MSNALTPDLINVGNSATNVGGLGANIFYGIPVNSNLAFILSIVAGALFLVGALLAFINLLRDRLAVHLFIIIFALERVATYIIRALLYKRQQNIYGEVFEILEAAGTCLIITILYHVWAGTARTHGTKRGKAGHCCIITLATVFAVAGSALFIAGAILQDRVSATQTQFDRGFKLRKAAVIIYGGLLAVLLFLTSTLIFRKGARRGVLPLFLATALLAAKAGFQIYAVWKRQDRYYENKFFWPLLVLTELLALLILVLPGVLRKLLKHRETLPVTDVGNRQVGDGTAPYGSPMYDSPAIAPTYK